MGPRAPSPGGADQRTSDEKISYGSSIPQSSGGFDDAVSLGKTFAPSDAYGGARPKTTQATLAKSSPRDVVNIAQQFGHLDTQGDDPETLQSSVQYLHELVLNPILAEEIDEWFTRDEQWVVCGNFTRGYGGTLNLPHFVWSDMKRKHCLVVNGEVFSVDQGPLEFQVNGASKANSKESPSSLSIQSHFLQGVRVATSKPGSYVISRNNREFPSGILYNVIYDKLLDSSIVMETMLGLRLHDNTKLLKFSGDLLSGYLATHRHLLQEFSRKISADVANLPLRDTIEQFLQSPAGLKCAHDFIEYSDAFKAVIASDRRVLISDEDLAFVETVQMVLTDMILHNPEIIEKFETSKGTSVETLRMLYGLTSPHAQFLNCDLMNYGDSSEHQAIQEKLTAHFLIDSDFSRSACKPDLKVGIICY
ncbi:MAG: hypothetical protein ACTJLL_02045 [Anaplasma sp.]